jgi:hypothetical protein
MCTPIHILDFRRKNIADNVRKILEDTDKNKMNLDSVIIKINNIEIKDNNSRLCGNLLRLGRKIPPV